MLRGTLSKILNFAKAMIMMLLLLITSTTALLVGLLLSSILITVSLLATTFRHKSAATDGTRESDVIDLNKSEYSSVND